MLDGRYYENYEKLAACPQIENLKNATMQKDQNEFDKEISNIENNYSQLGDFLKKNQTIFEQYFEKGDINALSSLLVIKNQQYKSENKIS